MYARWRQAARGEWFHSYGVNADILDLIRRTLDVHKCTHTNTHTHTDVWLDVYSMVCVRNHVEI
jgi:hypothetical protein